MRFVSKQEGIFVSKPNGTDVTYYVFPEYEIHFNVITPGSIQEWHHHKVIEEVLFVVTGLLEAHWIEEGNTMMRIVHEGDVVRVEDTPHTFMNNTQTPTIFLVFRLILDNIDKRTIIKNDKYYDDV